MFWSIRKACCCTASSPPPTFRIATAVSRCWRPCSVCFPFSGNLFADSAYQGPVFQPRPGRHPARSRDRDRQAIRSGEGLRRPAQALGGRTHHRLAQPLPPTGQGLGEPQATRSPSSSSRPFDSCSENSVILHKVSGRTLRVIPPPGLALPLSWMIRAAWRSCYVIRTTRRWPLAQASRSSLGNGTWPLRRLMLLPGRQDCSSFH